MQAGRLLSVSNDQQADCDQLAASFDAFQQQAVDMEFPAPAGWEPPLFETTVASPFHVTGPATYHRGSSQTLEFLPAEDGWKFQRRDLPEQLPIRVCPASVWSAARSVILHSGCENNRMRMTEHIIAHRLGLGLDNVTVTSDSGDPPLFDVGSMPIVEAIEKNGLRPLPQRPLSYFTPKETVTLPGPNGSFLQFVPAPHGDHRLHLDVAIDFPNAIGKQRIRFELCPAAFTHGAHARTNCPRREMLLARTIGWLCPEIRNMGYTLDNILIAGRNAYVNAPALLHNGKSLEAAWHRACLDLVAALSLFPNGHLAGTVLSYKAGHRLDCRFMTLMELQDLWTHA